MIMRVSEIRCIFVQYEIIETEKYNKNNNNNHGRAVVLEFSQDVGNRRGLGDRHFVNNIPLAPAVLRMMNVKCDDWRDADGFERAAHPGTQETGQRDRTLEFDGANGFCSTVRSCWRWDTGRHGYRTRRDRSCSACPAYAADGSRHGTSRLVIGGLGRAASATIGNRVSRAQGKRPMVSAGHRRKNEMQRGRRVKADAVVAWARRLSRARALVGGSEACLRRKDEEEYLWVKCNVDLTVTWTIYDRIRVQRFQLTIGGLVLIHNYARRCTLYTIMLNYLVLIHRFIFVKQHFVLL